MPNHCENDLRVFAPTNTGPNEHLKDLVEFIGPGFDFNKIIPYPAHYAEADRQCEEDHDSGLPYTECRKDGFNNGGYEWCLEHWDTKWGAYGTWTRTKHPLLGESEMTHYECVPLSVKIYKKWLKISFATAWSPPNKVIIALSARFPELKFCMWSYECGAAYRAFFLVKGGVILRHEHRNYYFDRGG